MTTKEVNMLYERIVGLLDNGVLKTAFELIQTLISGTRHYTFQGKLDELQETYGFMLNYFAEGIADDMRGKIYSNIITDAYELTDKIRRLMLITDCSSIYYTAATSIADSSAKIGELLNLSSSQFDTENYVDFEATNNQIFISIWTGKSFDATDAKAVGKALNNETMPLATKCQIVSSLLLGLQLCFDIRKLLLLFDAALSDNDEVKIRAYIAVCLTLDMYKNRIRHYPDASYRLENLAEEPDFKRIITTIGLRFILSRETEKVSLKLQDELIPEMMKFVMKKKTEADKQSETPDIFGDEFMNPEWENILEDSSLAKKIEEYNDLQEEGIDVMHSTFINLKNFPFFRSVPNWFIPFTPTNVALTAQTDINSAIINLLHFAPFICNSDKFSMAFSLSMIPEKHKAVMIRHIEEQFKAAKEQFGSDLRTKASKAETITAQYIQDLFRFYKLFPKRAEFEDIFNNPPEVFNIALLKPYMSDHETLMQFAELYLRKNYFADAQHIYEQLVKHIADDGTIYQKLGYCKQMNGDIGGALDDYLRSEILNPNSKWLIRRIGSCYKQLKQPQKALEYYMRLETMMPDNAPVLILAGHCYLDMQEYFEALKYYFKADYIDPQNIKAWRAIAWCSFLCGKYDQARNYSAKILEMHPQTPDYLNAGHTEWADGQIKKAIGFYRKAIETEEEGMEKFVDLFTQDIPILLSAGIKMEDIPFALDYLRSFQ